MFLNLANSESHWEVKVKVWVVKYYSWGYYVTNTFSEFIQNVLQSQIYNSPKKT